MINLEHHCIPYGPGETLYVKTGPDRIMRFVITECVLTIDENGMNLSYKNDYDSFTEDEVYGTAEAAFSSE